MVVTRVVGLLGTVALLCPSRSNLYLNLRFLILLCVCVLLEFLVFSLSLFLGYLVIQ